MALTYGVTRNINEKKKYSSNNQPTSETWSQRLNDIYDQIKSRPAYSYNQQNDPLYQQYQQMYERNAKLAQENAVGQAAALSGGYSNSYAETAGQAMYNQAMNGLNERAAELEAAARDRYNSEINRLLSEYQLVGQQYSTAYNAERDALADERYDKEWQYQLDRDAVADRRYAQEFAYQKSRDAVSDSRYADELEYSRIRDDVADKRYAAELAYQQSRDKAKDSQFEQEIAYKYAANGYVKDKDGNWKYTGSNESPASSSGASLDRTKSFIASIRQKNEFEKMGGKIGAKGDKSGKNYATYLQYVEDEINDSLKKREITDEDAIWLINYYGL